MTLPSFIHLTVKVYAVAGGYAVRTAEISGTVMAQAGVPRLFCPQGRSSGRHTKSSPTWTPKTVQRRSSVSRRIEVQPL
jgi:hypothetical protein